MQHLFTVDVEEYFQVSAFDSTLSRDDWNGLPSRVAIGVDRLLEMLAAHDARGTFFTLGWIADRHPEIVRRIAGAGHEIASHGWWHRRVTTLSPDEFRRDVRDSKTLLEDVSGTPVVGFRAPSFSIVPGREWALEILAEEGYRFDSSLFPIRRSGYGYPSVNPAPHHLRLPSGASLLELPPATTVVGGLRVPAAGGGYLRQFPFAVIRRAFREHQRSGTPGVFYIHPWELDPEQPRLPVSLTTRLRHYRGLAGTRDRIERLLSEFRFTSVSAAFAELSRAADRADTPNPIYDVVGH